MNAGEKNRSELFHSATRFDRTRRMVNTKVGWCPKPAGGCLRPKTRFERESQGLKPSSADCVNHLAQLSSSRWNEVDKQMAAPAETRTPNLHRANQSAHRRVRMEGWRQWRPGGEETVWPTNSKTNPLTPTGLLMEGEYTHCPPEGGWLSLASPAICLRGGRS
jgi:hypothetical protein